MIVQAAASSSPARAALALMLSAGLLAACSRTGGGEADARICTPFTTTGATAASAPLTTAPGIAMAGANAAAVDDCLHRWSYRLAASTDAADQVGKAAVQACGESLAAWNTEVMNSSRGMEEMDPTTGRPIGPVERNDQFAQGKALFYVVQARAGHCALPG